LKPVGSSADLLVCEIPKLWVHNLCGPSASFFLISFRYNSGKTGLLRLVQHQYFRAVFKIT